MSSITNGAEQHVKRGVYRHYKGNEYFVYELAQHSESQETLVVYRCLYGDRSLWVRPLAMFLEHVQLKSQLVPRFSWVREEEKPITEGEIGL